jgi:hypothetical protein
MLRLLGFPLLDFVKYIVGLLLIVYVPGRAILWAARLEAGRLANTTLSLVLGLTSTAVIYKLAGFLKAEAVFFFWILACAVFFVFKSVKRSPRGPARAFRVTPEGIGLACVALAVLLMLVADNYRNALPQPDGSIIVHTRAYDGFLRDAVVRELSHTVPPQMPFAAGYPLSYHYGMDLFNAIFYKYIHIGVPDLNHRLSITFFFALLVLTSYLFVRDLSGSGMAGVLAAFLVIFGGGGLAYLSTLFWGVSQWGNAFFTFHFVNLVNVNSFLPGLAILLAGFYALSRYLRTDRTAWVPLASFLLAASLEFKMFFAFPLFAALGAAAGIGLLFRHDPRMLKATAWTAAFSAPLLALSFLSNRGGPQFVFSPRFVDWIWFSLSSLKLRSLLEPWTALVHQSKISLESLLASGAAIVLFFVGGFGLNALAFPSLLRGMRSRRKGDQIRLFLGLFAAACVAYFFFVRVTLGGKPRNFTNSYVYAMAPLILCFFLTEWIAAVLAGKRRVWKVGAVAAVLALSVPNTAHFLWIKVRSPQPLVISRDFLEAARWLSGNSPAESIVLTAPDVRLGCYFADRRVVLEDSAFSFVSWHLTQDQQKEREDDIRRFFGNPGSNGDVLIKYRVSYVWTRAGDRRLGSSQTLPLQCVFGNQEYELFRVQKEPPG